MRRIPFLALLVLVLMATPVLAQQEAGDSELQLQGSLLLGVSGDTEDFGSATGTYGRFLTDRQEAGGTLSVFLVSNGDWAGSGGPFYRYNFVSGSKTVPYVGAAAVATFGEFAGGDIQLDLEGGSRWFLTRNTAFSLSGVYSYDVDASDFADTLRVLFGFSYIWNK